MTAARGRSGRIAEKARASRGRKEDHVILTIDLDLSGVPLVVRYMTGVGAMTVLGYDLAKDARLVMVFDLTAALRQLDAAIDKAAI